MCEKNPWCLKYAPGRFMTQEMCEKVVEDEPENLRSDHLKTQGLCNKAVPIEPLSLAYIPDHFKTQEICDRAVKDDSSSLQFVSDWFMTREWVDMWYDDYYDDDGGHWDDDDNEDKFFEWYDGCKKRKVQKASIKEELLPIALQPSRYWDWCVSEIEKREIEKLWR